MLLHGAVSLPSSVRRQTNDKIAICSHWLHLQYGDHGNDVNTQDVTDTQTNNVPTHPKISK